MCAFLLGGHRTFSLFHFVIAINLRSPQSTTRNLFREKAWRFPHPDFVEGCSELHFFGSTFEVGALLLAVQCPSIFRADLRSPPGDQVGNLSSTWLFWVKARIAHMLQCTVSWQSEEMRKDIAKPSLTCRTCHTRISKSYLHVLCFCISCNLLQLPTLVECMEENGSLSARAQLAVQIFIKRVFTIFATNASYLA